MEWGVLFSKHKEIAIGKASPASAIGPQVCLDPTVIRIIVTVVSLASTRVGDADTIVAMILTTVGVTETTVNTILTTAGMTETTVNTILTTVEGR
jgi:hypothetical protein